MLRALRALHAQTHSIHIYTFIHRPYYTHPRSPSAIPIFKNETTIWMIASCCKMIRIHQRGSSALSTRFGSSDTSRFQSRHPRRYTYVYCIYPWRIDYVHVNIHCIYLELYIVCIYIGRAERCM